MKDLIAERDKKEKMKHSIVKWWNVHYMTPEERTEEQVREASSASAQMTGGAVPVQPVDEIATATSESHEMEIAQEIIDRLNREAAEDEARKQQEIEQARLAAQANFNETTGSFSGSYGADGADEVHRAQIDAILAEKDDAMRDLIEHSGGQ